jgi:hypothetical protein
MDMAREGLFMLSNCCVLNACFSESKVSEFFFRKFASITRNYDKENKEIDQKM